MINKNFIGNRIKFMNTISRKDGLFVLCASELINDQPYVNQERCDSKRYGIVPLNKTPNLNYITNSQDLFPTVYPVVLEQSLNQKPLVLL